MKKVLIALAFLMVSSSAFAQVTAQPGQNFKWNQPTSEVATVARFELKIDTGVYVDVGKTAANDASTPAGQSSFSSVIPALTPGAHSFVVRACPASGACSPDSASFAFSIIVLSQPSGLRIGN